MVIDAIPSAAVLGTLNELGASALAGKVLMKVANDLNKNFELAFPNASLGAAAQEAFPDARVVKTLSTQSRHR